MTETFDTWKSYFYPETYDPGTQRGTLKNLFGERDPGKLRDLEYAATWSRVKTLRDGLVSIPRTFDARHLRGLHAHLFQDVYPWAGQFRTSDFRKHTGFAEINQIAQYLDDAHAIVAGTPWGRLGRRDFVARAAHTYAYLNWAHPFREGNGRTFRRFMDELSEQSPFSFQWSRVTPEDWCGACNRSAAEKDFGYGGPFRIRMLYDEPFPEQLHGVFGAITLDRVSGPTAPRPAQDAEKATSPTSAVWRGFAVRVGRSSGRSGNGGRDGVGPRASNAGTRGPSQSHRGTERGLGR